MLYRCGMVDEAMLITVLALDNCPEVVATHFMLANLYAAKVCFAILCYRRCWSLVVCDCPVIMFYCSCFLL